MGVWKGFGVEKCTRSWRNEKPGGGVMGSEQENNKETRNSCYQAESAGEVEGSLCWGGQGRPPYMVTFRERLKDDEQASPGFMGKSIAGRVKAACKTPEERE